MCYVFLLPKFRFIYILLQDNDSHFHEALDHWRQLNLSPSFILFAHKADSLSASMPLLLHNWKDIYALWLEAFESADDEGFRVLLECVKISFRYLFRLADFCL
jgi:hypothetical protein